MTASSTKMPTLFIPHGGGPCFFMDWTLMGGPVDTWDKTAEWLKSIPSSLPEKPKALLVVSAHWEEQEFTVSTAASPDMIYDYSGFPAHTYELNYPAPGAPDLANRVQELMVEQGLDAPLKSSRGYDHGVFVPLLVAFPDADIPILGLMCVPPADVEPAPFFALLAKMAREEGLERLSMGMSGDYETAIMLGATDIRVGTALFGERPAPARPVPGSGRGMIRNSGG